MDSDFRAAVSSGDVRALTRAITLVEAGSLDVDASPSHVIGITGPPGVGKSTLVSSLISEFRSRDETVAVLAVDPSSPITGGAILGDRIRMQAHIEDEGVYIRSMASRGHLGGLARASSAALALMEEAGFDRLIVETVGVGQSEVEVMNIAEIVVLVVGPGFGDQMQADKAGITEIADVFVVNKADRPGSDEVASTLTELADSKQAPVIQTVATEGKGVGALANAVTDLLGG